MPQRTSNCGADAPTLKVLRSLAMIAMLATASGCQAPAPTASPASSALPTTAPVLGSDWGRTLGIARPPNFEGTLPPSFDSVHPILRFPGQAVLADVTATERELVAVGYVPPDWTPAAWTSANGLDWAFHPIASTAFTFPVAVTAGSGGDLVAVGRSDDRPVAWTSSDGATWQLHDVPVLGGSQAERMTAVASTGSGYVAGGSAGPELFERHARFWTSRDGTTWEPVPDDAAAFADAEVTAITTVGATLVAVGVLGPAQHRTGAVAWASSDGRTWDRIDDPAFADALVVSIVAPPFGGLLAVGSDLQRTVALAWLSTDGQQWTRITAGDYGDQRNLWMTDVAAVGDQLIAVGTAQANQRSSATSWMSADGVQWIQARNASVFEQVELFAVAAGGPGAVSVGVFGGPDSAIPAILVTPGSGNLRAP